MTSAFFWQNSIRFCPASFCIPRPVFFLLQVLLDFQFVIPVAYNEKDIFWWCQFQKVLQVFIESFNFIFFSITSRSIDLDYCNIEWFALETKRDHSVIMEIASKYCISDSFIDYDGYSISSKGFLPTVIDITLENS